MSCLQTPIITMRKLFFSGRDGIMLEEQLGSFIAIPPIETPQIFTSNLKLANKISNFVHAHHTSEPGADTPRAGSLFRSIRDFAYFIKP